MHPATRDNKQSLMCSGFEKFSQVSFTRSQIGSKASVSLRVYIIDRGHKCAAVKFWSDLLDLEPTPKRFELPFFNPSSNQSVGSCGSCLTGNDIELSFNWWLPFQTCAIFGKSLGDFRRNKRIWDTSVVSGDSNLSSRHLWLPRQKQSTQPNDPGKAARILVPDLDPLNRHLNS